MEKWEVKDEDIKTGSKLGCVKMRPFADNIMRYLISDVANIKNHYMILGRHLSEFKRENYHLDLGFDSFEECIQANLGLDKSSVNRCINVYRRFGRKNVIDKYEAYNYSQLVEMLSMKDEELEQIEPDMSVRKIRDIKAASHSCTSVSTGKHSKDRSCAITIEGKPNRITKGGFMRLIREYCDKLCGKYENIVSIGSMETGRYGTKEIYVHVKCFPGMNDFAEGQYKIVIQKMK